jgi:RNA recognition motif-containing protein
VNLPKGFAYVEFASGADANDAKVHMDGAQLDGNVVAVKFVLQPKSSPLPPPPPPPPQRRDDKDKAADRHATAPPPPPPRRDDRGDDRRGGHGNGVCPG